MHAAASKAPVASSPWYCSHPSSFYSEVADGQKALAMRKTLTIEATFPCRSFQGSSGFPPTVLFTPVLVLFTGGRRPESTSDAQNAHRRGDVSVPQLPRLRRVLPRSTRHENRQRAQMWIRDFPAGDTLIRIHTHTRTRMHIYIALYLYINIYKIYLST